MIKKGDRVKVIALRKDVAVYTGNGAAAYLCDPKTKVVAKQIGMLSVMVTFLVGEYFYEATLPIEYVEKASPICVWEAANETR
jgi:hypothetical protein